MYQDKSNRFEQTVSSTVKKDIICESPSRPLSLSNMESKVDQPNVNQKLSSISKEYRNREVTRSQSLSETETVILNSGIHLNPPSEEKERSNSRARSFSGTDKLRHRTKRPAPKPPNYSLSQNDLRHAVHQEIQLRSGVMNLRSNSRHQSASATNWNKASNTTDSKRAFQAENLPSANGNTFRRYQSASTVDLRTINYGSAAPPLQDLQLAATAGNRKGRTNYRESLSFRRVDGIGVKSSVSLSQLPVASSPSEIPIDIVKPRATMRNWNASKLLQKLYTLKLEEEIEEEQMGTRHVPEFLEGHLEKLPMGKRKATLLKTWKRRHFRVKDGVLLYYDQDVGEARVGAQILMMGGTVEDLGARMIGVDDGRGHYMVLRAPTSAEHARWLVALSSNTVINQKLLYVSPVLFSTPHSTKKVLIVDIGSASVRAGVLGEMASLPSLYFPSLVAVADGKHVYGPEALLPEVRSTHVIRRPVGMAVNADRESRSSFNLDMEYMPTLFNKICQDLQVDPAKYLALVISPQTMSQTTRENLVSLLLTDMRMRGVCIINQTLLALHSYKSASGLLVDIGERTEIIPVTDGFVVDGAVQRLPIGGSKLCDLLKSQLSEYRLYTPVENYLARYIMEQSCYVSSNYKEDAEKCLKEPAAFSQIVDLSEFDIPDPIKRRIQHDLSRFRCSEALFDPGLLGTELPGLHKAVHRSVQLCPMDSRREMYRSIYLSGGVSKLPGLVARLQSEISKLVPPSIVVQVHAAPNRHHSAYVGACTVAALPHFPMWCVTPDEWKKLGAKAIGKWAQG